MFARSRAGAFVLFALTAAGGCDGCDEETGPQGGSGGSGATGGAGGSGGAGGGPGGIQIPGLSAPVQAKVDELGFLHLGCATDDDCFAALGYFHAKNRFFFMDFVRNLVRGKLGALVKAGPVVLAQDFANRHWFSTADGEPLEQRLYDDASPTVRGHVDAYTRGVNAWIADMRAGTNDATLTTEYDFSLIVKEAIRDWEPADSAAVGLYVLDDLSNNSRSEIAMAEVIGAFPPALAADLFSSRPVFDAFTVPAAQMPPSGVAPAHDDPVGLWMSEPLLGAARERLGAVGAGHRTAGETGSNNWVVGPGRTAGGNALLADDPHLLLTNPSIWFPVEIDAKSTGTGSYHVAGSTFPGLPAVMVGHNESIAWGVTTAYYDLADVYVEDVSADGTTVTFNGQDVAIVERTLSFEDSMTGMPVEQTFRWVPHHGPIVAEDTTTNTALSVRWRGHEGGTDLDAFFAVARAASVGEARQGIELASSASQNFVIVDTGGDIGWYPYSRVPDRPWASAALAPWLPLPGDGSAEWSGSVAIAMLPQLTNPPAGVIATANQDHTGACADGDITNDGQPALQAWVKADGTRLQRILDLLAAGGDQHSVETMTAAQGDAYSLYGEVVVPYVLAAAASGPPLTQAEQDVVDALGAWQLTCPTGLDGTDPMTAPDSADPVAAAESVGCTAFHATLFALVHAALSDEIAASGVDISADRWDLYLVARALRDPASIASGDLLWDDVSTTPAVETRDEILRRAITLASAGLAAMGPPNAWRWGRTHTLTLRSIYDNFGVATYNDGPYAASGGLFTVNVANPIARALPEAGMPWDFAFAAGASVRFVVEARPDRPYMTYQLPGGSDLHRESPYYNNLLPNWLANEPVAFPFGPDGVPSPAIEIEITPAP